MTPEINICKELPNYFPYKEDLLHTWYCHILWVKYHPILQVKKWATLSNTLAKIIQLTMPGQQGLKSMCSYHSRPSVLSLLLPEALGKITGKKHSATHLAPTTHSPRTGLCSINTVLGSMVPCYCFSHFTYGEIVLKSKTQGAQRSFS